jgi:paraquat-inducible protein A
MRDIDIDNSFCNYCGVFQKETDICAVCGSEIHKRKKHTVAKTWIYTITAFIFLFPANLLPMMIITKLTVAYENTIFDGVVEFFYDKEYFISFIIFFASIFIPVFKILAMIWLLVMVKVGKNRFSKFSTKLYQFLKFIGKFSMLDIFVVTLMVGFMQFNNLIYVEAGEAIIPFGMVVIFTMLATKSFDSKFLWDEPR